LFVLKVMIAIDICKDSWVIDRDECHLDDMGEGIVIPELCEVLSSMD
jgi:hypothetical protein